MSTQHPTIAQTTAALDALRDAARAGDHTQYAAALASARALDCTEDQTRDAYHWGARQRMTLDTHLCGVIGFDWQGNEHHPATAATAAPIPTAMATAASPSSGDHLVADVSHYAGERDGATVVEIDAPAGQRVRVYVNDDKVADMVIPE